MQTRAVRPRAASLALIAVACSFLLSAPRPAFGQQKEKQPTRTVVKYLAHKEKVSYQGKQVLVLQVEPVEGGRPIELLVKNHDMNKRDYNPVVNTDNVNALQRGEAIKIELDDAKPKPFVTYLKKYDLKPGEENPRAYVFEIFMEKGEGRQAYTAVVLSKFDEMTTLAVPQKRGKDGQAEPDAEIMELVKTLNRGDVVEVDSREGRPVPTLVHIDRYSPPQTGKLVKLAEGEIEGQKTPAVEIEREGKTVTALVPGKLQGKKWVADGKLSAAVKRLKPEAEVVYRTREDDGKVWLKSIEPAPKQQEKKEKDMASAAAEDGEEKKPRRGRAANR